MRPVAKWKELFDEGRPFKFNCMNGEEKLYERLKPHGALKKTLKLAELSTKSVKLVNANPENTPREISSHYSLESEPDVEDDAGTPFEDHFKKNATVFRTFTEIQKASNDAAEVRIKLKGQTQSVDYIHEMGCTLQGTRAVITPEKRRMSVSKAKTLEYSKIKANVPLNLDGDVELSGIDEGSDSFNIAPKSDRPGRRYLDDEKEWTEQILRRATQNALQLSSMTGVDKIPIIESKANACLLKPIRVPEDKPPPVRKGLYVITESKEDQG